MAAEEEDFDPRFDPGHKSGDDLRAVEREERIVRLIIAGKSHPEIASQLGISATALRVTLKEIALRARLGLATEIALSQRAQHERIRARLAQIDGILDRLASLASAETVDYEAIAAYDKLLRAQVLLMDRQAKLLGLDIPRPGTKAEPNVGDMGGDSANWINTATPDEIAAYAKQFKMRLPTEFET